MEYFLIGLVVVVLVTAFKDVLYVIGILAFMGLMAICIYTIGLIVATMFDVFVLRWFQ